MNYKLVEQTVEILPQDTGFTTGNIEILKIHVVLTDSSLAQVRSLIREWVAKPGPDSAIAATRM